MLWTHIASVSICLLSITTATYGYRHPKNCEQAHGNQFENVLQAPSMSRTDTFLRFTPSKPLEVAFDLIAGAHTRKINSIRSLQTTPTRLLFSSKDRFDVYFETQWFFGSEVREKLAKLGVVAAGENLDGQGGPANALWRHQPSSVEIMLTTSSLGLLILATQQSMPIKNIRLINDVESSKIQQLRAFGIEQEDILVLDESSYQVSPRALTKDRLGSIEMSKFGRGLRTPVKNLIYQALERTASFSIYLKRDAWEDQASHDLLTPIFGDLMEGESAISMNLTIADALYLSRLSAVSSIRDHSFKKEFDAGPVSLLDL